MTRVLILTVLLTAAMDARKFYADDPLPHEPKPGDVGAIKSRKLSDIYDLFSHQFSETGQRQPSPGSKKPIRSPVSA